jgi:hypothetical protein
LIIKRKMKKLYGLLVFFLLSCHSKKTVFRFHSKEDQPFEISISKESSMRQESFIHDDTLQLKLLVQTTEGKDSSSVLKLTFKSIEISKPVQFLGMLHLNLDWKAFLQLFNGLSFYAWMDDNGSVQHITYGDDRIDSIARTSHLDKSTIKALTRDHIGAEAMKDLLNRFFSCTPGIEVVTNDNWQSTILLTSKAPVKVNSLYTLKEQKADTVFLDMQGIISARTGSGGTLYLEGTQNGNARVSYSTGIPWHYEINAASVYTTPYYKVQYNDHLVLDRALAPPSL